MKYQKILNLLDNAINQLPKFRTKNWIKINDQSKGRYDNSYIRFKTSIITSTITVLHSNLNSK